MEAYGRSERVVRSGEEGGGKIRLGRGGLTGWNRVRTLRVVGLFACSIEVGLDREQGE